MMNRMFKRSDSSSSTRSCSTTLTEIPQDDGTINSESYQLLDLDQKLGIWTPTQFNYSTIKKKILSIVLCI